MTENTPAATAAPKKPAARRKKTSGPTPAAARKKLGITQEDLDLLAQVKEARAAAEAEAQEPTTNPAVSEPKPERPIAYPTRPDNIDTGGWTPQPQVNADAADETHIDAKLKVYQTLKEAGLPIPEDIRNDVERYVATVTTEAPQAGPWFARNRRAVEFRMRLDRQKSGTKSTTLKARGQRGDLVKLQAEDLEDDNLIANVELGIIEIIPLQEARDVIAKQTVNQQAAVHPTMAILRNELGKPYEQTSVPVVGDNSYTVAHLQPQGGEAGNLPDQGRGINWEAARNGQAGQPAIGNPAIFSDGFADQAQAADALARRTDIEGPAAGLGGLQFAGLAPVEKA